MRRVESSGIGDRQSDGHRDPGRARLRPALSGQRQCRGLSCLASASPGPLGCLLKPDHSGRDEAGAKARGAGTREGPGGPVRSWAAGEAGAGGGGGGARPGSGSGPWWGEALG